ncbi:MAG: hypothetical protein K8R77_15665 [Anaerolineaceae bacterium]|nr:hypothetical protein [Anaerolineaceae bacterium]
MDDLFDRVTSEQDIFKKLLSKVPGFKGYIDRSNRRASDKLLRDLIADRFEEQWKSISALQRQVISDGAIEFVDDLEGAAIKLRQVIDRVRNASYGYAGFFDAVKINEEELSKIYEYDLGMLDMVDMVKSSVDNVEASLGTDGLPAAIRHLTSVAADCVEAFNRRSDVILTASGEVSE